MDLRSTVMTGRKYLLRKDRDVRKVPDIDAVSSVFGDVSHLPKWEHIPDKFKDRNELTYWNRFICGWFFKGVSNKELESLTPKPGVDKTKALKAVAAILQSWDPKHEHKEAGAAFLMSEWFENPKE